jgi:hypothetical protein
MVPTVIAFRKGRFFSARSQATIAKHPEMKQSRSYPAPEEQETRP